MATLYVEDGGFRFPYPNWTETSVPQNMMFLEAQLQEYLHGHVTASNILYAEQEGFRVPNARSYENLDLNMKFVEAQVDQFLHSHVLAVTTENILATANAGFEDGVALILSTYVLTDVQRKALPLSVWLEAPSRVGDGATVGIVSGSAGEGSKSLHLTHASANLNDFHHVYYKINLGQDAGNNADMDFSIQVNGKFASSGFKLQMYDSSDTLLGQVSLIDPPDGTDYTEWTTLTTGTVALESTTRFLFLTLTIVITNNETAKVDDIQITVATSTTTTPWVQPEGFRFPYAWTSRGSIANNRKFLEAELSQFLHKHVVEI